MTELMQSNLIIYTRYHQTKNNNQHKNKENPPNKQTNSKSGNSAEISLQPIDRQMTMT